MLLEETKWILKNGQEILIRSATSEDAEAISNHRYTTSAETHFMAREPEDGRCKVEIVRENLRQIEQSEREFTVTAFLDGKIIGDAGVTMVRPHLKWKHRAYFGISILQSYCELGLGSIMLQVAQEQARKNGFEQIELGVFADNPRAIHVYEKAGFQKVGIQPRAFKLQDGSYVDEIEMVKFFS